MESYKIRKQFIFWEEVEVFADNEEEAVKIATDNWKELAPERISHFVWTGHTEIVLPGD